MWPLSFVVHIVGIVHWQCRLVVYNRPTVAFELAAD
jgi:hypothetical protein